jgi:hypothetical protein
MLCSPIHKYRLLGSLDWVVVATSSLLPLLAWLIELIHNR